MDYWAFLKQEINCRDNMFTFGRTKEVQDRYIKFKSNISNIYSYLIKTLFINNQEIVFKDNDFPYKFDCEKDSIKHYLLWINPKNKRKINARRINRIISKKILDLEFDIVDYIVFKNNTVNKSVETIDHYHVLFRIK